MPILSALGKLFVEMFSLRLGSPAFERSAGGYSSLQIRMTPQLRDQATIRSFPRFFGAA